MEQFNTNLFVSPIARDEYIKFLQIFLNGKVDGDLVDLLVLKVNNLATTVEDFMKSVYLFLDPEIGKLVLDELQKHLPKSVSSKPPVKKQLPITSAGYYVVVSVWLSPTAAFYHTYSRLEGEPEDQATYDRIISILQGAKPTHFKSVDVECFKNWHQCKEAEKSLKNRGYQGVTEDLTSTGKINLPHRNAKPNGADGKQPVKKQKSHQTKEGPKPFTKKFDTDKKDGDPQSGSDNGAQANSS